jgi:dolichyl-diphosphooligosaccharide--protein glycosyltransferase
LRHAQFAAEHFPAVLRWDPGTHYPNGQVSDAAGLFDLVIGGAAWLVAGGPPGDHAVAVAAAFAPVAIGGAILLVLYWLSAQTLGREPGIVACALFTLYPGSSLSRTEIGFADHHGAELLLSLWTVAALIRHLNQASSRNQIPWWRPALWAPLPLAVFVFTWKGAPAHLLATGLAIYVYATFLIARGLDLTAAACALFRYGTGLLIIVAVVAFAWPNAVLVSHLMPAIFGAAILLMLGPAAYLIVLHRFLHTTYPAPVIAGFGGLGLILAGGTVAFAHPDTPWFLSQ